MNYFENKTVLVPFDFSDQASAAIDEAIEYAEESTSIHVIHVVDPTPIIVSVDPAMPVPPSYDTERYQRVMKQLDEKFSKGKYTRVKTHCEIGDPGSEITDFAKVIRADLIMMPTHGRRGIGRLLLGSVAERVLRLASCEVLILRKANS